MSLVAFLDNEIDMVTKDLANLNANPPISTLATFAAIKKPIEDRLLTLQIERAKALSKPTPIQTTDKKAENVPMQANNIDLKTLAIIGGALLLFS